MKKIIYFFCIILFFSCSKQENRVFILPNIRYLILSDTLLKKYHDEYGLVKSRKNKENVDRYNICEACIFYDTIAIMLTGEPRVEFRIHIENFSYLLNAQYYSQGIVDVIENDINSVSIKKSSLTLNKLNFLIGDTIWGKYHFTINPVKFIDSQKKIQCIDESYTGYFFSIIKNRKDYERCKKQFLIL